MTENQHDHPVSEDSPLNPTANTAETPPDPSTDDEPSPPPLSPAIHPNVSHSFLDDSDFTPTEPDATTTPDPDASDATRTAPDTATTPDPDDFDATPTAPDDALQQPNLEAASQVPDSKPDSIDQGSQASVPEPKEPAKPKRPLIPTYQRKEIEPVEEKDRRQVAEASDPSQYQVYQHDEATLADNTPVHLFAAMRIGAGHVAKGMACQDGCGYQRIPHGVVLADADGVSECPHSELGSEYAVKAAIDQVEALSQTYQGDESAFVKALCDHSFFIALRARWASLAMAHWNTLDEAERNIDKRFVHNPLLYFATTLLIAVVTEHWYVTLNLGDGQMMLFNDLECMNLQQNHKETQAPRTLAYPDYLEYVRYGVWPRERFHGIAISTDGIHDRLAQRPWNSYRDYVNEAAARFMEKGEPYRPFVFTGTIFGEMRTYDISREGTSSDDCSIVMALTDDWDRAAAGHIHRELKSHLSDTASIALIRHTQIGDLYHVYTEKGLRCVTVIPKEYFSPLRDPRLDGMEGVRIWEPETRWASDRYVFSCFTPPVSNAEFLEVEFQSGVLNSRYHLHDAPDNTDMYGNQRDDYVRIVEPFIYQPKLDLLLLLRKLERHLALRGLKFTAFAMSLLACSPEPMVYLPLEALCEAADTASAVPWSAGIRDLFPSVIGYLSAGDQRMALFDPGEISQSRPYYMFDAPLEDSQRTRLFAIIPDKEGKNFALRNISPVKWVFTRPDGRTITISSDPPHLLLLEGRTFSVTMCDGQQVTLTMHDLR